MKLSDYLKQPGKTATALAEQVGCSVSTISRAASGKVIPSREQMCKIFDATDELVTPNDFFGIGHANCAECAGEAA